AGADPVDLFRVAFELFGPEVHLAQVAGAVTLGLVVEVRRRRVAAFAARGHRARADLVAELHRGNEAVAAGAVVALRARPAMRAERGQRAPARRGERHRDARPGVVEHLHDRAVVALVAVDLAPGRAPAAEILLQAFDRARERGQPRLRTGLRGHVVVDRLAGRARLAGDVVP